MQPANIVMGATPGLEPGTPAAAAPAPGQVVVPAGAVPAGSGAEAASSGVAAKVRAKRAQLENRRKTLDVPPYDVWGEDLKLVIKPVSLVDGMTFHQLILKCTESLLVRNDDTGELEPVAGGWAGMGQLMGIAGENVSVGEIITAVCSSDEVVTLLGEQVMAFCMGRRSSIEQILGE